jgi:hypothetical protein
MVQWVRQYGASTRSSSSHDNDGGDDVPTPTNGGDDVSAPTDGDDDFMKD